MFAPQLELSLINNSTTDDDEMTTASDSVPEGAEARFKCTANANPNEVTYKWFINDELVVGDYTTEMVSACS